MADTEMTSLMLGVGVVRRWAGAFLGFLLNSAPGGLCEGLGEGGGGAGWGCRTVAEGTRGQALARSGKGCWTFGEASLLWGSLVLEPGEAGWLGPPTTHPPPHSCTSSTLGLEPSTPTPALGQVPAPGLAPGQGQW